MDELAQLVPVNAAVSTAAWSSNGGDDDGVAEPNGGSTHGDGTETKAADGLYVAQRYARCSFKAGSDAKKSASGAPADAKKSASEAAADASARPKQLKQKQKVIARSLTSRVY